MPPDEHSPTDSADARAWSERIAKDIMNHEYMEAYRRAISFFAQAQRLASRDDAPPSFAELRRAAVSMVVHIAQGAGRPTVAEQRPWVAAARRRARECAALLADDPPEPVTPRAPVDPVDPLQPVEPTCPPDRRPTAANPSGHDARSSSATTRPDVPSTAEARTQPRERASPPSDDREPNEGSSANRAHDEGHGAAYGPTHGGARGGVHGSAYRGASRIDRSDSGIETVRVRLARVLVLLIWLEAR